MSGLNVPYFSYDDLRRKAISFLSKWHPDGTIPVPIEEIIELKLKLDIIPTPGLKRHFDVDSFISRDMESILVDEYNYGNVPNRYRFSLAHEIAHAVLHQKIYHRLVFSDITSWKAVQVAMPAKDYGWLEWQAYSFAGLVLVPTEVLKKRVGKVAAVAAEEGVSLTDAPEIAERMIAGYLTRDFEVSRGVIEKRIAYEGIRLA